MVDQVGKQNVGKRSYEVVSPDQASFCLICYKIFLYEIISRLLKYYGKLNKIMTIPTICISDLLAVESIFEILIGLFSIVPNLKKLKCLENQIGLNVTLLNMQTLYTNV